MGPSPNDPKVSFVKKAFTDAATKVNSALKAKGLDCCVSPDRIFISDTFLPGYKLFKNSQGQDRAFFFIPATDFVVPGSADRIALDLAAQVGRSNFKDQINDIVSKYNEDGSKRPWYSLNPLEIKEAVAGQIFASQLLNLPLRKLPVRGDYLDYGRLKEEEQYVKKYVTVATERLNNEIKTFRFINNVDDFERELYSFRIQRMTTANGPETGDPMPTRCRFQNQDQLFLYALPKCRTLHLSSNIREKLQSDFDKLEGRREWSEKRSDARKVATGFQVGVFMVLLAQAAFGNKLKALEESGRIAPWAVKKISSALFGGTFLVGSLGFTISVWGEKYDFTFGGQKLSDLQLLVGELLYQTALLENSDDPDNEVRSRVIAEKFNSILLKSDPRIIRVLNDLTTGTR